MNKKLYEILSYTFLSPFYKKDVSKLNLKGNEKVLDFGCGIGACSRFIAKELSKRNGKLTCFDISMSSIKVAKKRLKRYSNIDFLTGDLGKLDIEKQTFDVILAHLVIYHTEKNTRQNIVNELSKLLKGNGSIFIFHFLFGKKDKNSDEHLSREDLVKMIEKAGLTEIKYKFTKSLFFIPAYIGEFKKA